MPKVLINVRLDSRLVETLKTIAAAKGEKYLSIVLREALEEYISSYTGELTLNGLRRRISEIDMRLKKVENTLTERNFI